MMDTILKGVLKKALPGVSRSLTNTELQPEEVRAAIMLINNSAGELQFQIVSLSVIENNDRRYLAINRILADGTPEELLTNPERP